MVAMGHVTDRAIGSDAAGVVKRVGAGVSRLRVGDRVAVLQRGAMRTNLRVDSSIPQKLPDDISLEDGATIPTVFVTAYHALIETAHLERGETVLIHRASGGELNSFDLAIPSQLTWIDQDLAKQ
jgi:NADPH:quinone reductase-like Zn-dependent oxidoreductase